VELSLRELTFHLTDKCNLGCSYCFQARGSHSLEFPIIREALDFFQGFLEPRSFIVFYGGEPLLAFDTIRRTLAHVQEQAALRKKEFRYSISTNGSLLTEEVIAFLNTHRFQVNLSHDGTAQDTTRPSRMNPLILENLDRMIRFKQIKLTTNSVFVPATVEELFPSARFLIERGVPDCGFAYSITSPWDLASLDNMREQVRELRRFLLGHYRQHSFLPVANFRGLPVLDTFRCAAGWDRMSLAADGRLWGCRFFADFFASQPDHPESDRYCYGPIRRLAHHPTTSPSTISRHYDRLRQDSFSSEEKACRKCRRLLACSVCPAAAAFSTGLIGKIPAWTCEIKDIWRTEARKFWRAAGRCQETAPRRLRASST
jgi:radical SAM protein with 4Fe4S-binding SPASM domain